MRCLRGILLSLLLLSPRIASSQPAPPPPPDPSPAAEGDGKAVQISYDHGLSIETANRAYALKLTFRNQLRFESTRATDDDSQFVSHFQVTRSRLQAEGHVFGEDTRYKLEFSLGDAGSFSFIKDLFVDKQLTDRAWLRAGQWKRPFNRQEIVSDFGSQFNERANTAAFVGGGRDIGVAVHNDYEKSPAGLEWAIGVFNGFNGGADRPNIATTCTQNAMTGAITCTTPPPANFPNDFGPAVVARVGWNIGKVNGYSEGDLDGGPLRLAVALSYKIDLANLAKGNEASVADNESHGLEADAMLKVEGFSTEVGLYAMKLKAADAQFGALVQPGYFVVPKRVEVCGRFAIAPAGTRNQIEVRGAFNYYWQGHTYKWATDAGFLQLTGEDPTTMVKDKPDFQVRSMLQLVL